MLRTPVPIPAQSNRLQGTNPIHMKEHSPFVSAPKVARSPVQAQQLVQNENAPVQNTVFMSAVKLSKPPMAPAPTPVAAPATANAATARAPATEARPKAVQVSASTPILSEVCIETPSRRLAPREFQELMRHFKSPVDKQVSCCIDEPVTSAISLTHIVIKFAEIPPGLDCQICAHRSRNPRSY